MTDVLLSRLGDHPLIAQLLDGRSQTEWTAGEAISANRVLTLDSSGKAAYLNPEQSGYPVVIGVSLTAGLGDEVVQVMRSGEIVDPSWIWQPGPVWVGTAGTLTQVTPTTGWLVQVGIALDATKLQVETVDDVILL